MVVARLAFHRKCVSPQNCGLVLLDLVYLRCRPHNCVLCTGVRMMRVYVSTLTCWCLTVLCCRLARECIWPQLPTLLVVASLALVAAFVCAVATGLRMSMAELILGSPPVEAVWAMGGDGAGPTRMVGVLALLTCLRLAQSATTELYSGSSSSSGDKDDGDRQPQLITSGPYAWTRQPFSMAAVGVVLSLALVFDTLWVALWAAPVMWYLVRTAIPEEERALSVAWPRRLVGSHKRTRVPFWVMLAALHVRVRAVGPQLATE